MKNKNLEKIYKDNESYIGMKKGVMSVFIVLGLFLAINLTIVSAEEISFDSTGVTSKIITLDGQTYTIELVSATYNTATISVTTSNGNMEQKTIEGPVPKIINGIQISLKSANANNVKYTATIDVSPKPDPNDIILDSSGTTSAERIINGKKYTITLVSATTSSATISVTNNGGISQQQEISEGLTKVINGIQVYVRSADLNNVRYTAIIQVSAKPESDTCTDSDGGIDYYVKGETIEGGDAISVDNCQDKILLEQYCENGMAKTEKYSCPNGCKDGACIKSDQSKCYDSDGGENIYEAGDAEGPAPTNTVNNGAGIATGMGTSDYCDFSYDKYGILFEAVCKDNLATHVKIKCPSQVPYCNKGICSQEPGNCVDSDGGWNYKIQGTVTESRMKEGPQNTDYCENLQTLQPWYDNCKGKLCGLREYACGDQWLAYNDIKCPDGCKDGACIGEVSTCQPQKCDDGSMTECKESNGLCSCSSCPPIIIKPVCGNGVCESGEGEICAAIATSIFCAEGEECKMPKPNCFVVCPQDCKITEGIYANLNEKFKLQVYQPAKIMDGDNSVLKLTFKDLIAYKCVESHLGVSESQVVEAKVASVTGNAISEVITTPTTSGGSGGGSSTAPSSSGGGGVGTSVLRCIGAGPKALLAVEIIVNEEFKKDIVKNNIINLEVGEKKQVKDFTIYFSGYDYASKTGIFLVSREIFNCPKGCKCDVNGNTISCSNKTCNDGETLCSDGTCKDKCDVINPDDCKYGCMYEGKCFPIGVRSKGLFCSSDLVMSSQMINNEICENNFECSSNVCVSGKCISEGLMEKIINWFSQMFGRK